MIQRLTIISYMNWKKKTKKSKIKKMVKEKGGVIERRLRRNGKEKKNYIVELLVSYN